jgi:hypothetical protein
MWRRSDVTDGAAGGQARSGLIPARGDARTVAPPLAVMKFVGWNCRGKGRSLSNSNKMEYLAKMMRSTAAQVTFVSETRSSKCTTADLNARFNTHDSFVVPSVGLSGGLWLMWSDEINLQIKLSCRYYILALAVHIPSNVEFLLACVYGDPHHNSTNMIWDQIADFVSNNLGKPMICLGDLNNIMHEKESYGAYVNYSRMRAFNNYVKQCGLFDLGFSGPAYTWTNMRFSTGPIFERLDRCLANAEWCTLFPMTNVFNMPIIHSFSDHAPILLSTGSKFKRPRLSFKFENWWPLEEDYQSVPKNDWASTTTKPFHVRTNHLAGTLKVWCKKKRPLQQQLDQLQNQINDIQMQPLDQHDHALEAILVAQYEGSMTKLNEFYKQRAKKHWVTQGDKNTSFFHQAVTKRRRRNMIISIVDRKGQDLFDPQDIANEFITYFRNIFQSSCPSHSRPPIFSVTNRDVQDFTNSIPDKEEIWNIIKDMKKDASPGPDGFNVGFYRNAWNWIAEDVTQLVRTFYETGIMPPNSGVRSWVAGWAVAHP